MVKNAAAASADDSTSRKSARVDEQMPKGQHKCTQTMIGGKFVMQKEERSGLIALVPTVRTPVTEVVGFDMDDTLIATKSGKVFATGRSDWRWWHPSIPDRLKRLHGEGKAVVIFSNQSGIAGSKGYDQSKADMLTGKILDMITELQIPIYAFLATGEDEHRKPSLGMWAALESYTGTSLNKALSLYVGDAAGRAANWKPGRKKDFSCSDRKFAYNLGITFHTPEEYFLSEKAVAFDWDGLGPDQLTAILNSASKSLPAACQSVATREMVVLVGWPAAGKSTFAKTHFVANGYVWINRDTLKTPAKCMQGARDALAKGKSVIIDNTNPTKEARGEYIRIAKESGVPCRCLWMDTPVEFAKHLNMFRERMGISDHVPRIAYASYNKNFEEPIVAEGFASVERVPFVAAFDDAAKEAAFRLLA